MRRRRACLPRLRRTRRHHTLSASFHEASEGQAARAWKKLFDEFLALTPKALMVSATPAELELQLSEGVVVEQIIRPTGLLDPEIEVRPVRGQVDDLLNEIRIRERRGERVLVTTLTKRMSEDLTRS